MWGSVAGSVCHFEDTDANAREMEQYAEVREEGWHEEKCGK
jgi:hypothetical protein